MSRNSAATKVGHGLAKVLGIKIDYRNPTENITRGESTYSVTSADTYVEQEPTSWEWIRETTPSPRQVGLYFYNIFPFLHWITRYNSTWLVGDLVAGITIGAVVVPQGMAYAKLATLQPEYGLYTSFMGVLIYWFFATSKDITIGPVAVLSTVTGNVVLGIQARHPEFKDPVAAAEAAGALAVVAGGIVCAMGLIRLGRIVDFISLASISAFMTGSALNIAVGQVPGLMGMSGFDTRASTYQVVISILTHFNSTKLDAALGFTALFLLYFIRWFCNFGTRRWPKLKKTFFFANTLRTIFVILLYTLVSWLANKDIPNIHGSNTAKLSRFNILGTVPRGFAHSGVPKVNSTVVSTFLSELPSTIIVMIIEHIAIAKSFGRVNGYNINPSQEFIAIGITNLLGPFLGAYPATGSFSRTAIKAKAGVRTPFAGVITAIVVLIAIYGLTAVFFYIPSAALSAVIIHAVGDLITPPNTVYQFWRISPLEVLIFFAGVIVTVFTTIEIGVYVTVAVSAALFLFRALFAKGRFLGRVKIHSVVGDQAQAENKRTDGKDTNSGAYRNVYIPIEHGDGSNPEIEVEKPYPGVFIYRFSEGFNYPNANHYLDNMAEYIFQNTRRTTPASYTKLGDRPWNNPGPPRGQPEPDYSHLPELKAVILDFSSVNNVDISSIQTLIDVRNQLDRWVAPNRVAWHFACINNRWTKRALASAGFGYLSPEESQDASRWKPVFSVAELGGNESYAADADRREQARLKKAANHDEEDGIQRVGSESASSGDFGKGIEGSKPYIQVSQRRAAVQGINLPLFHIDLTSALQSAISNVERNADVHMVTATHGTQDMDLLSQTRIAPTLDEFGKSPHGGHEGGNTN